MGRCWIGCLVGLACSAPAPVDLAITGGWVVDGTGAPLLRADIGVRSGRIVTIGEVIVTGMTRVIDATDLVVAPGFIDLHAHVERGLTEMPGADNLVLQGITTVASSAHSGQTPWPLDDWLTDLQVTPNTLWFVGHNTVRRWVVGETRLASPEEVATMAYLVDEGMKAGAAGLSTGLVYVPGSSAEPAEIETLLQVVARHDGRYATHIRDSSAALLPAVQEAIHAARTTQVPTLINHFKATTPAGQGALDAALQALDAAEREGVPIRIDAYPFASTGSSSHVFEPLAPDFPDRLRGWCGGDLDGLVFRSVPSGDALEGMSLRDVLILADLPLNWTAGAAVVRELHHRAAFRTVTRALDPAQVDRILLRPGTMVESDGNLEPPQGSHPHPRSFATFPRFLQRYVRERGDLTLEQGVHRLTAMPADWLGLSDRGRIAVDAAADFVVFDPATIGSPASVAEPRRAPEGIRWVVVNGVPVAEGGTHTHARPGHVLR